ncbi:MAG: ferrous iron transport protein A [Gammaproteobacteria bacterium]|nr:ferrous iron transport protein A [Gammaproteobacteria bacterium]MCP5136490.1 ferrous iron transport protein A [Gammaproteobacteria bacterium]
MSTTLNELPLGQTAVICAIGGDGELRTRIQSMGLRVGRAVAVIRRSRFGGPLQVRIGTTDLLIRPQQALLVELEPLS